MKYFERDRIPESPPPPGFTTSCVIRRWIDGDTVDVEICRIVRVRLLGIDTDELDTELGQAEAEMMSELAPSGTHAVLYIPSGDKPEELVDNLSLGRVLGHVFVDGKNVAVLLRERLARHSRDGDR